MAQDHVLDVALLTMLHAALGPLGRRGTPTPTSPPLGQWACLGLAAAVTLQKHQ